MGSRRKGVVIAIDHGAKNTGFAVTDALRITFSPLAGFRGDRAGLIAHVSRLVADRDVEAFVIGLPLHMHGGESPRARDVRAFAAELAARFPEIRIAFQDERLTTKAAEELLRAEGASLERKRALGDSLSALVILRDWVTAGEPG